MFVCLPLPSGTIDIHANLFHHSEPHLPQADIRDGTFCCSSEDSEYRDYSVWSWTYTIGNWSGNLPSGD